MPPRPDHNPPAAFRPTRLSGRRPIALLPLALLLALVVGLAEVAWAVGEPFPMVASIQDNVAFWQKVLAEHPSSQGLLHDSQNLAIVYEVMPLAGEDSPGCAQTNETRVEAAKERYRTMLSALAGGRPPAKPRRS